MLHSKKYNKNFGTIVVDFDASVLDDLVNPLFTGTLYEDPLFNNYFLWGFTRDYTEKIAADEQSDLKSQFKEVFGSGNMALD